MYTDWTEDRELLSARGEKIASGRPIAAGFSVAVAWAHFITFTWMRFQHGHFSQEFKGQASTRFPVTQSTCFTVACFPTFHAICSVHAVFADAIFISIIILILVEVAEESRSALDAVHPGHGAVAVLSPSRGAELAASAVIQHRAPAALRRAAQRGVAFIRAADGVFTRGTPRVSVSEHHQQQHRDRVQTHGLKC